MTGIDDHTRRSRAYLYSGVMSLVVAVLAAVVLGWLAAVGMALLGAGNLAAVRDVRRDGEATPTARAIIVVGGLVFLLGTFLAIQALRR